ncbi:MAG: hypothetical protein ACREUT_06400 [Steroidobacteraceae bacterium]
MRVGLTACAVLAAAALLGLMPLKVFAAATEHASTPAKQDASARQAGSARQEASARENAPLKRDALAQQQHAASDRPPGSDRPHRGVPQQPHGVPAGPPPDLSAPPINHVMTPEQVHALISTPEAQGPEDVMVEEGRYEAPVPQGQIRALAWALLHPLEAWRIFTPVTDE